MTIAVPIPPNQPTSNAPVIGGISPKNKLPKPIPIANKLMAAKNTPINIFNPPFY